MTVWMSRVFIVLLPLDIWLSSTVRVEPSGLVVQMIPRASLLSQNLPLVILTNRTCGSRGSRRRRPESVLNHIEPFLSWSNPDKNGAGSAIALPICSCAWPRNRSSWSPAITQRVPVGSSSIACMAGPTKEVVKSDPLTRPIKPEAVPTHRVPSRAVHSVSTAPKRAL